MMLKSSIVNSNSEVLASSSFLDVLSKLLHVLLRTSCSAKSNVIMVINETH
jgi:hypothetical protein